MDGKGRATSEGSGCHRTASGRRPWRQAAASLVVLAIVAAACGPVGAGGSPSRSSPRDRKAPAPPVEFNARPEETCDPQVFAEDAERVRRSPKKSDRRASARLAELLKADQEDRSRMAAADHLSQEAAAHLEKNDAERRAEVLRMLREGRLSTAEDMEKAATIFNHGRCLDHFALAAVLAAEAVARGSTQARRTYAVNLDRYLVAAGRRQKFGTQMRGVPGRPGACELAPVDPATTDDERRSYGVEPLVALRAKAASGENRCVAPPSKDDPNGGADGPGPTPGARQRPAAGTQ